MTHHTSCHEPDLTALCSSCSFYSDFHSDLDDLAELSRYNHAECQNNYEALLLTSNPDGVTALCKFEIGAYTEVKLGRSERGKILQIPHLERFFMSRILISLTRGNPQPLPFTPQSAMLLVMLTKGSSFLASLRSAEVTVVPFRDGNNYMRRASYSNSRECSPDQSQLIICRADHNLFTY